MLLKYRPEDKAQKKERLLKRAQAEAEGKTPEHKKPIVVKYGLNHVTYLIEQVRILYMSNFFELFLSRLDNNRPQTSLCRTKLSWLSLPMTWIQLNWLYGSLHFAGKWRSHIVLWRGRLDWELWVAFYRVVSRLHKRCICSNWFNILFIMNANCRLSIKRLPPFCAWPLWRMRTSWTSARF